MSDRGDTVGARNSGVLAIGKKILNGLCNRNNPQDPQCQSRLQELLCKAIKTCDLKTVKDLIDRGVEVNQPMILFSPVMGATLNHDELSGNPLALGLAVRYAAIHEGSVNRFAPDRATLNDREQTDRAEKSDDSLQIVICILDCGANIEAVSRYADYTSHSVLMRCFFKAIQPDTAAPRKSRYIELATLLLNRGANAQATNDAGMQSIHCAAALGDIALYDLTQSLGASPGALDARGRSALLHAVSNEHRELAVHALRSFNNAAQGDHQNRTPMEWAAMQGDVALCDALLGCGAQIDSCSHFGSTPLHQAARKGHTSTCLYLLDHGATIDCVNRKQQTPLHLAAQNGDGDTCSLLVLRLANVHALDECGRTAKGVARDSGESHIGPLIDACLNVAQARVAIDDLLAQHAKAALPGCLK